MSARRQGLGPTFYQFRCVSNIGRLASYCSFLLLCRIYNVWCRQFRRQLTGQLYSIRDLFVDSVKSLAMSRGRFWFKQTHTIPSSQNVMQNK